MRSQGLIFVTLPQVPNFPTTTSESTPFHISCSDLLSHTYLQCRPRSAAAVFTTKFHLDTLQVCDQENKAGLQVPQRRHRSESTVHLDQ